jgi:hypothetical protein
MRIGIPLLTFLDCGDLNVGTISGAIRKILIEEKGKIATYDKPSTPLSPT